MKLTDFIAQSRESSFDSEPNLNSGQDASQSGATRCGDMAPRSRDTTSSFLVSKSNTTTKPLSLYKPSHMKNCLTEHGFKQVQI